MNRQIFTWGSSEKKIGSQNSWIEWLWIAGLLVAALILLSINLHSLPLQDWQEARVAQTARAISQIPFDSWLWLFPNFAEDADHFYYPPLIHILIASTYKFFGVSELTTRLPSALLTAISVPLLYGAAREVFPNRIPALFTALVYLTLLPVMHYGRLAVLDGPLLCFENFLLWSALRSRRDLRWTLGLGLGFGLLCLTKGGVGLLIGGITLVFLGWDTPRLLTCFYLWLGLLLGSLPVLTWYLGAAINYQQQFFSIELITSYFGSLWQQLKQHDYQPWYYSGQIAQYAWPWLIFSLYGIRHAWTNSNWSWAKLVLSWSIGYFFIISIFFPQNPSYALPLYPVLALSAGSQLAEAYNLPRSFPYPRIWKIALILLACLATLGCIYFSVKDIPERPLTVILAATALTLAVAAILVERRDQQFIMILFWGTYICLLLLFSSPYWIFTVEARDYPVKEVATILRLAVPKDKPVYSSFQTPSPALNFYSDRRVVTLSLAERERLRKSWLERHWREAPAPSPQQIKHYWLKQRWEVEREPYLLLDEPTLEKLDLPASKELGTASLEWKLIAKETEK